MGSEGLLCPLCCGNTYPTRAALRAHLTEIMHCLRCPACELEMPSLSELCQHLETEECGINDRSEPEKSVASFCVDIPMLPNETVMNKNQPMQVVAANNDFQGMMKLEDLKQESKPKDLAYVDCGNSPLNTVDGNDSHILIVGSDSGSLLGSQSIITTQNEDGTISFTPIENEEPEGRDMSLPDESEVGGEGEGEGELYSCNTCGVSFTSVLQHIQTYHSQQDVVVEVAESESENIAEEIPMGAVTKRVITASGDIVETSTYANAEQGAQSLVEEECVDKDGRTYTRRFVKIDKFWSDATDAATSENPRKINEIMEFDPQRGCHVKLFSCGRCLMKCKSRDELDGHVCKSHGEYLCPHCPVTYSSAKSLCAHMKVHKPSANKLPVDDTATRHSLISFKCEDCDTEFPSNKSLRLHRRMHEPVKSRPMEGPIAYIGGERAEREAGAGGGGGGEGGEDTYHCSVCDKWIHEGYRKIHNEFHSTSGAEQHHCEICNRKFLSQDYLLMHMNVHNHDKANVIKSDKTLPYSCLYCTRRFARPHEKVKHERIHTGEKPHSCEICGKSFRVSYCLTLHMRTHTGARPYACAHCGKRFKAHSVYNHHLLTHSEVRAYKCPYCPKAFKTSVQLAGHKNSHTKPFSCTHCNRPFASLYAVRVHTETHRRQNNLKFSCRLCGASYARAFALKDHMRTAHDDADVAAPAAPDYSGGLPEAMFDSDAALPILPKKENNPLGVSAADYKVEDLEDSRNEEILP